MNRPVTFTQQLVDGQALTAGFTAVLPEVVPPPDPGTGLLHGSEVTARNTGVVGAGLSYTDLARIGDTTLTEKWLAEHADGDRIWLGTCPEKPAAHWHFERWDVSGRVRVSLDDAHVRVCRITTDAQYPLQFLGKTTFDADYIGLIAEWLEITGTTSQTYGIVLQGRRAGSALVRRVHVHGHAVGVSLRRGNTFVNCLVEKIRYYSGSHNTCASTTGGTASQGVAVIGCRLMGGNSAALSLYTDQGPANDVELRNNYLAPDRANYALRAGEDNTNGTNHQANSGIVITGTVFGRDFQRFSGSTAPVTQLNPNRPGALWQGNRWGPRGPHWQPGDPDEGAPVTG